MGAFYVYSKNNIYIFFIVGLLYLHSKNNIFYIFFIRGLLYTLHWVPFMCLII